MAGSNDRGDGISSDIRSDYRQLIDTLLRRRQPGMAKQAADLAVQQGVWSDPLQRPLDYEPGGSHQPVYDPSSFWFTGLLESMHGRILAEIDAVAGSDASGFTTVEEPLLDRGRWDQVILYDAGRRQERACSLFPVTTSVVEQIPEATTMGPGVVTLSWLAPGTHIVPHCGGSNAQLRVHLGLRIPPGPQLRVGTERMTWEEGRCLVFDDSYEHEVWHRGDRPRLVLLLDVPHPRLDEPARKRALARRRTPTDQIARFLAAHDVRRIESDSDGVLLRPQAGTTALIRRYFEETGAQAVELREDRLHFE